MAYEQIEQHLTIQEWAEADRPREKLLLQGPDQLSPAELLAILINTGSGKRTAVDLGKLVMKQAENDLHRLGKLDIATLTKIPGIGQAKAITILAALELGRRRMADRPAEPVKLTNAVEVHREMLPHMVDLAHEEFWALVLNRASILISKIRVSTGGTSGTAADVKLVVKHAVDLKAGAIIVVHNHPSGNDRPSPSDVDLTRKLKHACALFDIPLLDHVIFCGKRSFYSFAETGQLSGL